MTTQSSASISFGVITMSDKGARGEREDTSGAHLIDTLTVHGYSLAGYAIVPDQVSAIVSKCLEFVDEKKVTLLVTTGGTGLAPTDVTPEAMQSVLEKEIPGIAEMMRSESLKKTPRACLSRGRSGMRGNCLIINFPGSLKAVQEHLEIVMPVLDHALDKIKGDPGDCGRTV